jgi:NAD/NADP transhydrogenase beta subunit
VAIRQGPNKSDNLFGFKQEDEIIGLPILDVLQPDDLNVFKQRFKKIFAGVAKSS